MIKAIISIFFLAFALNSQATSLVHLKEFNILHLSDNVDNLIFSFDEVHKYRFIRLSEDYWYIAIPGKIIGITTPLVPKGSVRRILVRIIRGETRIFFKMDSGFKYRFRIVLSKNHHFLVVRIVRMPIEKTFKGAAEKNTTEKVAHFRTPVIVIDPGHGGKDPGAIGFFGLKEKNITLSIGRFVDYFLKRDGYKVIMTRDSDTYPTLADRVRLANRVKADIFVSIHVNYTPKDKKDAKGLEVYFVNTTSDKRALRLAARENGMSLSQISDLNKIILSLIQTTKIQYSKVLASYIYRYMLMFGKRIYRSYEGRGVKQAPFYVLVGTRCPSVLVETAFINNLPDATYLRSKDFRKAIAKGIAIGIERFLKNNKNVSYSGILGMNPKS